MLDLASLTVPSKTTRNRRCRLLSRYRDYTLAWCFIRFFRLVLIPFRPRLSSLVLFLSLLCSLLTLSPHCRLSFRSRFPLIRSRHARPSCHRGRFVAVYLNLRHSTNLVLVHSVNQ